MEIMEDLEIKPRPVIREVVYEYLRNKILTGTIRSGERLSEGKLAQSINTSRTPVREALHKLEMESLIKSNPRSGYTVVNITSAEVQEICEIRAVLETLAAEWASARISAEELTRLKEIVEETNKKIQEKDAHAVVTLDTEFHDLICRASRSRRIEEISQTLRDHMLRFRMQALHLPDVARRSNEGHSRIVEAIEAKDNEQISEAVRFHLERTKKDVTRVIKEKPPII